MSAARIIVVTGLYIALVFALGCATPKEINGQKVLKAKWVNGQLVYVLEGNKEVMATGAAEAKEASKGVVFKPLV